MDYILIFFFFIILLVLVIFGLPIGRTSFNDEVRDIQSEVIRENFESKAPSTFSEWRDLTNNKFVPDMVSSENETVHSEDVYGDASYLETDVAESSGDCSKCNAPRCKNIDKYVLKSSVPPCPDLSNYILKSEIPPFPDMNNYIRKNEIPSCPTCPNMNDYIPKNQIPVCPTCPDMNNYMLKSKIPVCEKCPTCPTCPTCPKEYKNITENPKFKEWLAEYEKIVEDKINKNYISKKECSKAIEKAYKNGEMKLIKEVARRFRDVNFIDFIEKKLGQDIKRVFEKEREDRKKEHKHKDSKNKDSKDGRKQQDFIFDDEINKREYNYIFEEDEGIDKKKTGKYQTSYNTTNMNEIYNKWNTNFDNTYDGKAKENNYSNFADWNKSSLLLEEKYYSDIPTACNFS
jgi:hypothetical protein